MSFALEIVVANHAATHTILEGDGIVRAVFPIEESEGHLFQNALTRGRGFEQLARGRQARQIRVSWLYEQWLKEEVLRYNVPVLSPNLLQTLAEWIIEVVP